MKVMTSVSTSGRYGCGGASDRRVARPDVVDVLRQQDTAALLGGVAEQADLTRRANAYISGKLENGRKTSHYAEPLHEVGMVLIDEVSKGLPYLVQADPRSAKRDDRDDPNPRGR